MMAAGRSGASVVDQLPLFGVSDPPPQLLKWIGSKHRFAREIADHFPTDYGTYFEPFVGGGSVLGALAPSRAVAGDLLNPLTEIWRAVQTDPTPLVEAYAKAWDQFQKNRRATYDGIRASYNAKPNPADLLFISRSCYGGVLRFTKKGTISTPVGPHNPIPPESLRKRADAWKARIQHVTFVCQDFSETLKPARAGDLVYCDPPYFHTQSILYGAQEFLLERLYSTIGQCKERCVLVALSIDGSKKSGRFAAHVHIPNGLFKREIAICCGRSMLRRFQRRGESLEDEVVHDRLLLTW